MIGLVALTFLVRVALWATLVGFGVWAYRRVRLRSVPWLAVYLLAYAPLRLLLGELFSRRLLPDVIGARPAPFGWSLGELVASWSYMQAVLDGVIHLLLALLVLADVAFLIRNAGPTPDQRSGGVLLALRRRSTLVGALLVGVMALLPLAFAALWFF